MYFYVCACYLTDFDLISCTYQLLCMLSFVRYFIMYVECVMNTVSRNELVYNVGDVHIFPLL